MKKISFSLLIMLCIIGSAMAQQSVKQEILYEEIPVDVPQAVLDAVEKNVQGVRFQNELPVAITKKGERLPVVKQKSLKSYKVLTKSSSPDGKTHSSKTIVYDADGTVVSSRSIHVNKALPIVALRTIGKAYDGWLLLRTRAVIEETGDLHSVVYHVVLKNGKNKERLMLNEAGEIVKNKKDEGAYA
ncbi:MAG: hypothetical protein KY428_01590, partial [Bacteroidetes bacterium]|nr:hypothetical protein [Bacteroidota bacterium]